WTEQLVLRTMVQGPRYFEVGSIGWQQQRRLALGAILTTPSIDMPFQVVVQLVQSHAQIAVAAVSRIVGNARQYTAEEVSEHAAMEIRRSPAALSYPGGIQDTQSGDLGFCDDLRQAIGKTTIEYAQVPIHGHAIAVENQQLAPMGGKILCLDRCQQFG